MLVRQSSASALLWSIAALVAMGACAEVGVGPARVPDVAVADVDSAVGADILQDPCEGLLCAGHGSCVALPTGPTCTCEPGYVAAQPLTCVPVGQCPAGQVHAAGTCVAPAALTDWCEDYCATLPLACPPGVTLPPDCAPYCAHADQAGPACVATCLGDLDTPGAVQQTLCAGLMRRLDTVDCRGLALCEVPVHADVCADVCDAADACGLLRDRRLLLGSNRPECMLYCDALATALAPKHQFEGLAECLLRAMQSCDALAMLSCTVVGVPDLPHTMCTKTAPTCGFIPTVWSDAAACEAGLAAWSPGQQIVVGACLNVGGFGALCAEHACASPPDALPAGAQATAQAMMGHCPDILAAPADFAPSAEYYAWLFVGILRAFGESEDRDYGAIADCFLSQPCPSTKEGTLDCLLHATKD